MFENTAAFLVVVATKKGKFMPLEFRYRMPVVRLRLSSDNVLNGTSGILERTVDILVCLGGSLIFKLSLCCR